MIADTFRQGETNICAGCGETQWHVGRVVATCARCGFPVPIVTPLVMPATMPAPLQPETDAPVPRKQKEAA